MYILSYTTEDKSQGVTDWNDHYELFQTEDAADLVVAKLLEDEAIVMWAVSKVLSASEPHWVVNDLFEET